MNTNSKVKYRLYKSKKRWVIAALATGAVALSFQVGNNVSVHAADNDQTPAPNQQQSVDTAANVSAANSSAQTAASVAANNYQVVSKVAAEISATYAKYNQNTTLSSDAANANAKLASANDLSAATVTSAKAASDLNTVAASAGNDYNFLSAANQVTGYNNAIVSNAASLSAFVSDLNTLSTSITTYVKTLDTSTNHNDQNNQNTQNNQTNNNQVNNQTNPGVSINYVSTYTQSSSSATTSTTTNDQPVSAVPYTPNSKSAYMYHSTVNFNYNGTTLAAKGYDFFAGYPIYYQWDVPAGYHLANDVALTPDHEGQVFNVDILPAQVVTVVNFLENGQLISQRAYPTAPNADIDYNNDVPKGYSVTNSQSINAGVVSHTVDLNVTRNQVTTTLQFMHGDTVVATRPFTGVANSNIYLNGDVPSGYSVIGTGIVPVGYSDQTVQIQLSKNPASSEPTSSHASHAHSSAASASSHASHSASHATSSASSSHHTHSSAVTKQPTKASHTANHAAAKLPQTGEDNAAKSLSALGLIAMILSFGLYDLYRRKQNN